MVNGGNSAQGNSVSVLLGDGTGRFVPAPGSPFGFGNPNITSPSAAAVGDFNGGGALDLAVAIYNGGRWGNCVVVLLGDGHGGFSVDPGSPFPAGGNQPDALAVGDFKGDGIPDIAVANQDSNSVGVLFGDGHGGFSSASGSPFRAGNNPKGVGVADFNGDRRLDLAVADGGSNGVSVLLGDGRGGFSTAAGSPFPAGSTPYALAI